MLAAALGCDLRLVGSEIATAGGRADLTFELLDPVTGAGSGKKLIVESTLLAADDDHFARLMRYVSADGSAGAVLIAPKFDPHLQVALARLGINLQMDRCAMHALAIQVHQLEGRKRTLLVPVIAPGFARGQWPGLTKPLARLAAKLAEQSIEVQPVPGNLAMQIDSCLPDVSLQIAATEAGGWHLACLLRCANDVQAANLLSGSRALAANLNQAVGSLWQPEWIMPQPIGMVPRLAGMLAGAGQDEIAERIVRLTAVLNEHLAGLDRDFMRG